MTRKAAIVGIGRSAYTRNSGRTVLAQAAEAAREAIADAGLQPADVNGACSFQAADSVMGYQLADAIGIEELHWNLDVYGGGNQAAAVVANAATAIEAGSCETAIVFRAMNGRSSYRFGTGRGRTIEATGESQFQAPHGYLVPPQWMALWARRQMR